MSEVSKKERTAFEGRYRLDQNAPLPEFDTAGGSAYRVEDAHASGSALYGLVHRPEVPLRNSIYSSLQKSPIKNIISPIARGLMQLREGQRLVTVFDMPLGDVLLGKDGLNPIVNVGRLRTTILISAVRGLAELHKRGFTHRGIRAQKMFFAAPGSDEVILGECISEPPAVSQHYGNEALETVFADPFARGNADAEADIFQLGVALLTGFFGEDLASNRSRDALLAARVNQGSFWALSGGQDVPGALGKVLQGMLVDEASERWTLPEILDWLDGSTNQRRTGLIDRSLSRPTHFQDAAYVDRRLLADAFAADIAGAGRYLRNQGFLAWAQISLRNVALDDRLEKALGVGLLGQDSGDRDMDDQLISKVCMFLHPDGPIRFRGVSIMPDAVPQFIVQAFASGDNNMIKIAHGLLRPPMLNALVEISGTHNPALAKSVQDLSKAMMLLKDTATGKGFERVLYELNPQLPCLSKRFEGRWVGSLKQLLQAFDREASGGGGLDSLLMDRHVAAFSAAREGDLDQDFMRLASQRKDPARYSLQMAQFLGMLQKRAGINSLPKLTTALVEHMQPALKLLRNVKRREKVKSLLDKVKKAGNISRLTAEVNLVKIQQQDAREFAAARRQLLLLDQERAHLDRKITYRDPTAILKGYRASAVVAALACLLSLAMTVIK